MVGVCVYVKNNILKFVTRIENIFTCGVVLRIDKALFNFDKDILYICAYIPPEKSPYYDNCRYKGTGIIEQLLTECDLCTPENYVLIAADRNARTGSSNDELYVDESIHVFQNCANVFDNGSLLGDRKSCDVKVNNYGCHLLNLCKSFGLNIMNGRIGLDKQIGNFTYVSTQGCSVIDYFVGSYDLCECAVDLKVINEGECDHFPVCLKLPVIANAPVTRANNQPVKTTANKLQYIFSEENIRSYQNILYSNITNGEFDEVDKLIGQLDVSADTVVRELENRLITASKMAVVQKTE